MLSAKTVGKSWDNLRTDEQNFLLLFHVVVAGGGGDSNGIGIDIDIVPLLFIRLASK